MGRSGPDNNELVSVVEMLRLAYRTPDLDGLVGVIGDHVRHAFPVGARDPSVLDSIRHRVRSSLSDLRQAGADSREREARRARAEAEFRECLESAAQALDANPDAIVSGAVLRAATDGLLDAAYLQTERATSLYGLTLVKDLEVLGAPPSVAFAANGALLWKNSALSELIEHRGIDQDLLLAETSAFALPLCRALEQGEAIKPSGSRKQRGTGLYLRSTAHRAVGDLSGGAIVVQVSEMRHSAVLTPRELQAVQAICNGRAHREAAGEMGISLDSVRTLVRRAYRKFGVRNRVAMKARLAREGLLDVGQV